jgi:catechol 2,3-dioxygenase-like lactoylglutathione lyase family enzyme
MRIARIDHLVLTVRDIPATVDFYSRVLGMTPVSFGDGRLALHFGRQKINLHERGKELEPRAEHPLPGSADLCFVVEGPMQELLEHLVSRGAAPFLGPVPRAGAEGPIDSVYLRDPDDNLIELAVYREG